VHHLVADEDLTQAQGVRKIETSGLCSMLKNSSKVEVEKKEENKSYMSNKEALLL
jgi:hypothetical protein